MRIEHVAIWVEGLEKMKDFYVRYFNGKANNIYHNPVKNFKSYFISFDEGARLELMHRPDITGYSTKIERLGITHLAIALNDKVAVDSLTDRLRKDGYKVVGEPRTTGDGYYESVILDPEGNRIEITC